MLSWEKVALFVEQAPGADLFNEFRSKAVKSLQDFKNLSESDSKVRAGLEGLLTKFRVNLVPGFELTADEVIPIVSGSEEKAEEIFPFKNAKSQGIRRLRMKEAIRVCLSIRPRARLILLLTRCSGLDQVAVTNLIWNYYFYGDEWLDFIFSSNCLFQTPEDKLQTLVTFLQNVSNYVKRNAKLGHAYPNYLFEGHSFTGYKTLPDESFNMDELTKSAATGTKAPETQRGWELEQYLIDSLKPIVSKFDLTFTQFISEPLIWGRSGSSGTRFEVTIDSKVERIILPKNVVADVESFAEIEDSCRHANIIVNKALEKEELGKVRITTIAPLTSYLIWAYFMYGIGKWYKKWFGSTIDLTDSEYIERAITFARGEGDVAMIRGDDSAVRFGEIFAMHDFDAMDHQMTSGWVPKLTKSLLNDPSRSSDPQLASVADDLVDNQVAINPRTRATWKVDTLMSGLRQTTLMGAAFNNVKTRLALKICESTEIWPMLTDTERAYAYLIIKNAIGAVGAGHKQAVLKGEAEFLRERITISSIKGYSARVIPGLSQRKPWNSDPIDPVQTLRTLIDLSNTIIRRAELKFTSANLSRIASRAYGVNYDVVGLSAESGGLGFGPLKQGRVVRNVVKSIVDVKINNPWRSKRYDVVLSKYGVVGADTSLWAHEDIQSILISNRSSETFARLRPQLKKSISLKLYLSGKASFYEHNYAEIVYGAMNQSSEVINSFEGLGLKTYLEGDPIEVSADFALLKKRDKLFDFLVLRRSGKSVNEAFAVLGMSTVWYRYKRKLPYITAEEFLTGSLSLGRMLGESKYITPLIKRCFNNFVYMWMNHDVPKVRVNFKCYDVVRYEYLSLLCRTLRSRGVCGRYSA